MADAVEWLKESYVRYADKLVKGKGHRGQETVKTKEKRRDFTLLLWYLKKLSIKFYVTWQDGVEWSKEG